VLKASEISRDRVEDARNAITVGEEVSLMVVGVDRKARVISLSIKAREVSEEKNSVAEHKKQSVPAAAPTTVGDLLKSQLDKE
jgi:small subunit ribosomal protein S1